MLILYLNNLYIYIIINSDYHVKNFMILYNREGIRTDIRDSIAPIAYQAAILSLIRVNCPKFFGV